jgi:hypothetical protein
MIVKKSKPISKESFNYLAKKSVRRIYAGFGAKKGQK